MSEELSAHLDLDALEMLKEIMEDEFSLLINTFLNDAVERIEQINAAINAKNSEDIRRAAHSFKGSSANIGAHVLQGLCLVLEDAGHNGDTSLAPEMAKRIEQEFKIISQLLKSNYLA
ncbi:MAG: Hpt domain-containing protein [Saccharospirillaceae bacterium]|nr:Hpt domain-containing protein [Pseudomonadales bacterium]NRB80844.1 Hpt domain-containing protein [Saccharospirillaceae bacterium]